MQQDDRAVELRVALADDVLDEKRRALWRLGRVETVDRPVNRLVTKTSRDAQDARVAPAITAPASAAAGFVPSAT